MPDFVAFLGLHMSKKHFLKPKTIKVYKDYAGQVLYLINKDEVNEDCLLDVVSVERVLTQLQQEVHVWPSGICTRLDAVLMSVRSRIRVLKVSLQDCFQVRNFACELSVELQ